MEKKDRIKKDISRESYLQTVIRRFKQHHLATVSLVILAVLVVAALLAPIIAPYNPDEIVGGFSKAPTAEHWLGTDQIGRDVLSRLLYATRISLLVGVLATAISTVIGVILGLIAGYFGGAADMIIMRFTDMVMSFPYILLVLVAASIFKPGLWSIILILGFVDWPGIARLVRGNVLSLRESNFIKSDLVAGMPLPYILFSEILPNTAAPILVYATSVLALSMLDEAALSFLGMGVQPPTASLGNMLNGAQSLTVLTKQPWLWIPSGLMIVVLVIAINFIGDALDMAAAEHFEEVLLVGHVGKLVKLAGGIMNTHSRQADCRTELFCTHAALCGAPQSVCRALMDAATTDACLAVLDEAGLRAAVLESLLEAVQLHLDRRAAGALAVGAVLFSNQSGPLGQTKTADALLKKWKGN